VLQVGHEDAEVGVLGPGVHLRDEEDPHEPKLSTACRARRRASGCRRGRARPRG
jgi:hypothetical protein